MYIAAGQGQTTPGDKILISLKSDFIHVYSPRARKDSPQGTKFLCQQFQGHRSFGPREVFFLKVFTIYNVLAWRPSWSCDHDRLKELSFPQPREPPRKIWLQLA